MHVNSRIGWVVLHKAVLVFIATSDTNKLMQVQSYKLRQVK